MRYYEIYTPEKLNENGDPPLVPIFGKPDITTNLRGISELPTGTRIVHIVTDRDGSLIDTSEIPVVDGKPQIKGRGVRNVRLVSQR